MAINHSKKIKELSNKLPKLKSSPIFGTVFNSNDSIEFELENEKKLKIISCDGKVRGLENHYECYIISPYFDRIGYYTADQLVEKINNIK